MTIQETDIRQGTRKHAMKKISNLKKKSAKKKSVLPIQPSEDAKSQVISQRSKPQSSYRIRKGRRREGRDGNQSYPSTFPKHLHKKQQQIELNQLEGT